MGRKDDRGSTRQKGRERERESEPTPLVEMGGQNGDRLVSTNRSYRVPAVVSPFLVLALRRDSSLAPRGPGLSKTPSKLLKK